jgi:hypothetical protein
MRSVHRNSSSCKPARLGCRSLHSNACTSWSRTPPNTVRFRRLTVASRILRTSTHGATASAYCKTYAERGECAPFKTSGQGLARSVRKQARSAARWRRWRLTRNLSGIDKKNWNHSSSRLRRNMARAYREGPVSARSCINDAQDARRKMLIANVLEDFVRLSAAKGGESTK